MLCVRAAGVLRFLLVSRADEILKLFELFDIVIEDSAFPEDSGRCANFESRRKSAGMFDRKARHQGAAFTVAQGPQKPWARFTGLQRHIVRRVPVIDRMFPKGRGITAKPFHFVVNGQLFLAAQKRRTRDVIE